MTCWRYGSDVWLSNLKLFPVIFQWPQLMTHLSYSYSAPVGRAPSTLTCCDSRLPVWCFCCHFNLYHGCKLLALWPVSYAYMTGSIVCAFCGRMLSMWLKLADIVYHPLESSPASWALCLFLSVYLFCTFVCTRVLLLILHVRICVVKVKNSFIFNRFSRK